MGGAHRNELRWIGIGAEGLVHLIPCGHPKGPVNKPRAQGQDGGVPLLRT